MYLFRVPAAASSPLLHCMYVQGAKPIQKKEIDYMELLNSEEGTEDYDAEDKAVYEEVKRQEKQALVEKILKAKQQAQQQQKQQQQSKSLSSDSLGGGGGAGAFEGEVAVANKGQPSPYLQSAVAAAEKRVSAENNDALGWNNQTGRLSPD